MSEQPAVITGITPGLYVRGLERGDIPAADWLCSCGHHERATGRKAVTALCARAGVGVCPHTNTPAKEAA